MRILHALGWYFPESIGGTEVYVKALAERQRARAHEVQVAAPAPGSNRAQSYDHDGVSVFRYPIPAEPTRQEAQGRVVARGSEAFHHHLEKWRPEVLHVHTFTTGLGIHELEAAHRLGTRVVATNHLGSVGYICQRGTLMRWGESPCDGVATRTKCAACALQAIGAPKLVAQTLASAGHITRGALANLPGRLGTALGMSELIAHNQRRQRRALELVDRYVLLNQAARDVAIANGADPKRLELNYLGLSQQDSCRKPAPAEQPTKSPVTIGYLGRFVKVKGVLDLARAVASLPKELDFRLELRALIDEDEADLRERFDTLVGNDPRVRFAPGVPPEAVPDVLATYDVLCVPSVWFENGPTVVCEAHAVGTPVIGTRIGAMPELIDDGVDGAIVDPGDWRALAAVLQDVARRPAATIDAWRRALPVARTMDDVAADYESLYRELFDTSGG